MKRVSIHRSLVVGVAVFSQMFCLVVRAEIERLEFVETTGTQWIDTGLKLNFRRSVYRLNCRFLERVAATDGFAGMTDVKGNLKGGGKSFAVGMKAGNSGQALIQWCEGDDSSGYFHPNSGDYDTSRGWEIQNDVAVGVYNGSNGGANPNVASRQGHPVGFNDSSRKDAESVNTFYLGAVNNAGEGLYPFTVASPRMQWYGAQFWTDGKLVGDFVPAKQDGIAGFYDTVTETFFPSQGTDDFVAPQHVKWIGGNDGTLAEDANWEGGVKPSTVHQVAVFPAGVTNRYTVTDHNAVLRDLGGINLVGSDTLLWFDDISADCNSFAPVFGKGTYRLEKKTNDTKGLKLYGNSCNFAGLFDLTNAYVYPYVPSALGVYGKSTAKFHANLSQIRFYIQGLPMLHADITLGSTGQFVFNSTSSKFDGRITLDSGSKKFNANGNQTMTFDCDIADATGARRTLTLEKGYFGTGLEAKSRDFGLVQVQAANFTVNSPVCFTRQAGSYTIYNHCNFALNTGGSNGLVFACENAFNDEVFVLMCYADYISKKPTNIIDLNGCNQRFGKLGMYTGGFDGTTVWNPNAVITSATPATLTILETFRNDDNDGTGSNSSAYPGRVNGAASIVLDDKEIESPSGSTKRMRFNCPGSETTGSLTANGGYIEIRPTATFSNLTALVATKTGVIKVQTPDVGNATNLFVTVTNATSAKIEIAEGVTLKANTALMGETWLSPGNYSSVASLGVSACPQLSGTGVLHVENYGGKKGLLILFR